MIQSLVQQISKMMEAVFVVPFPNRLQSVGQLGGHTVASCLQRSGVIPPGDGVMAGPWA